MIAKLADEQLQPQTGFVAASDGVYSTGDSTFRARNIRRFNYFPILDG